MDDPDLQRALQESLKQIEVEREAQERLENNVSYWGLQFDQPTTSDG